jgi:hypothetical protein
MGILVFYSIPRFVYARVAPLNPPRGTFVFYSILSFGNEIQGIN